MHAFTSTENRAAKHLLKPLLLAGLAIAGLCLSPTSWAQDSLTRIMKDKRIVVGVPVDFAPYGFMGKDRTINASRKPQGLDIDMANFIGAKLGVMVQLTPVINANRVPYLQEGKVDVVISTLGKNPDREKLIDFTLPYSPFFQAVFASKKLSITKMEDLAGKTIGVTRGALEDKEITKLAPTSAVIKRFTDNNATVSAFVTGQVVAIATGAAVAGNMALANPELDTEFKLLIKDSPNYIGVPKGQTELRDKLNAIIEAASKSGELDDLSMKWLNRKSGLTPLK